MPWFKVDDTFAMHDKVMAAGNSAIGLWTRAGAWSMQQLTDGFVPDHVLRALGTPKERRKLVEVSLWVEAKGGIEFKNWEERQPTREQVETARQAAAERQRHARERAKSQRESQRDTGVSHGPPDPTRPDPTHKSHQTPSDDGASAAPAKPKRATKRGTKRPDDWRPNPGHLAQAITLGIDPAEQLAAFSDYCEANGKTYVDWNAAFRTWLRNAKRFDRGGSAPRQKADADMFERMAQRAEARESHIRGEIA